MSTEGKAIRAGAGAPEGVVAYLNGHAIKEDDKCTESLVGARFCQASSLEWQGRKVLMFVFAVRVLHFGSARYFSACLPVLTLRPCRI